MLMQRYTMEMSYQSTERLRLQRYASQ